MRDAGTTTLKQVEDAMYKKKGTHLNNLDELTTEFRNTMEGMGVSGDEAKELERQLLISMWARRSS